MGHIMAASSARKAGPGRLGQLRDGSKRLARRSGSFLAGAGIILFTLFALVALLTYHPSDPALNTSAGGPVANAVTGLAAILRLDVAGGFGFSRLANCRRFAIRAHGLGL